VSDVGTGGGPGAEGSVTDLPDGVPTDRAAALAEGAPGIPTHFVWWLLGAVLVLSLGGLIGEHLFSAAGLNPTATTTTTTVPNPVRTNPGDTPAPPRTGGALGASLGALMSLTSPSPRPAPPFTLTDQHGASVSMPPSPARVVVLTFFDAPCNDICPVLAKELAAADADLGARAGQVEFVTVNTDPAALASSAESPTVTGTALGTLPNWHMVSGPLTTLNALWKAYGISISLSTPTGVEAHNNVMDFIDVAGYLRYQATPFANESTTGTFTLPAGTESRWGRGIATYAERLIGQ
jgi:cytochrome oxidase Cu insertion factor (SCO1/SenC/PrrC family)